ncbi:MAG: hypothetical protein J5806_10260 [Lentisphaeria bacterium]|nr:hypothetical protein [Lentisphaeria bacterium]
MKHLVEQLIDFAGRHRFAVLTALLLLGLLAGLNLFRIRFTNDVSQLFPDNQDAGTTFRILNETKLGNTVQLEFVCSDSVEKHEKYLDAAAEKIARLPGVKNLVFRYRTADILAEMTEFTALLPRFYGPEILSECDPEPAVRNALKQLAFPVPGGVKRLRNQPFGLEMKLLASLRSLDLLTGMELASDLPYFAAKDKRRAMMVFDADLTIGDAASVRKLLAGIRTAVEPLPPGMEYRIVSGAMHSLGNEEVLKRDATVSGSVSLLLFVLIFLFFCRRDWRALWIPAIPLYASLLSLGVMTLFFREICLYVVGLGSCVTGLAVDQGIHVYSACRGKAAVGRTAALTEPMGLSALTSIMVFVFLALTGIRAYVQLAVFAGLSLAFSCLIALIVLPQLVDRNRTIREFAFPLPKITPVPGWKVLLLIIPAAAGLYCTCLFNRADFSLESLDGTPEAIRQQEKDFNAAWRRPDAPSTAVLAVSGDSVEEVLTRMREITGHLTEKKIFHAGPPLPPRSEQLANRKRWRTPAVSAEIAALEKRTCEACRKHRLPEQFFQPFFDRIRNAIISDDFPVPPMLAAVMKKMVKEHPGGASAVALLHEPAQEQVPEIREILKRHGGGRCALLSKEYFRMMIRSELGGSFLWILPLSIVSALLLAFAVFRRVSDVLLAMTPVFVSFCGVFCLGFTAFKFTPAAAGGLILLTGLAIDYGIYAVSQLRDPEQISARNSVFLSAATTVAGAGALVFSRHPALFGTGMVLSVGIALACLAGLYLVPLIKRGKTSVLPAALLFLLLLSGCVSEKAELVPVSADRLVQYPQTAFRVRANAVIRWRDLEHSVILAAELDPAGNHVKAAGVLPSSGMLIFRMDDTHKNDHWTPFRPGISMDETAVLRTDAPSFSERAANFFLRPFRRCAAWFREQRRKAIDRRLSRALIEDFRRIFLPKIGKTLAGEDKGEYIVLHEKDGTEWEIRSDRVLHRNGSAWDCEYRDRGRTVLYRNLDFDYSIRIREMKLAEKEKKK